MIPQLTAAPGISPLVADFITELHKAGFSGDTTTRYADRLTLATDNSIYQTLPAAVLFPRTTSDITFIARIADDQRFHALSFTPRGGGTGTNGQSLNHGVIVDMSRYMNHILEINPQEGWVRVEAGVVKDQLNAALKPYGYFFSPELSTSNRATLGGMINTDASGQGSMVYGKTSDHVLGLTVVLLGGTKLDTGPVPLAEAEQLAAEEGIVGKVYQAVLSACCNDRALVLEKFPDLNRFLTGYDLKHTVSDDLEHVDLTRLLCGSEGTLAFITEARLDITPLPKVRRLVNIKYDSFDSALRSAPLLVKAKALSVETVDSKVLNLAREDIIWHSVSSLITDVAGQEMLGLNIVEFAGDDESVIDGQVQTLCQQLEVLIAAQQGGVIGYQLCCDLQGIERIYAMRKKAVGLLGNAKGQAKPIPFVEDTCVPPQHVADYITEFRALLDGHGLNYGMFGHVDAGVLHVRPALDMCDPQQEILMKKISDEVVNLTARYGGLLWGEHGKGFRAEYSSAFFGEALFRHLRRIKAAFDPRNRLNPGKICTPLDCDEPMMTVDEIKRGSFDRRIPLTVRESWRGAMDCNGNGLCFNFDVYSPMCPSMKISANRLHSPKGRASLTREWLRLLAEQGVNPQQLEQALSTRNISWRAMLSRLTNSWRASRGEYDFSHEVKEAMSGCLACKACSTQCPIKIDVPAFRARFLQLYHTRYLRPVSDYLVASVESYTPIMAKAPGLVNFFLRQSLVKKLSQHTLGMVDLPLLSQPTLARRLKNQATAGVTLEQLEAMSAEQRQHCVLVVQDPFTTYYEAPLIDDLVKLITCLGYQPVILPFVPNGKAQHVKGFLRDFARTAAHSAEIFNRLSTLSLPMVGVDPALVLCYRDEYKEVLGEKRGTFCVQLVHEWLTEVLTIEQPVLAAQESWYLFGHCTETTALPLSSQQWQAIFSRYGARLENVSVGCCGMAGTYGHESKNLQNSRGIYALSWQKALEKLPRERCLATGYSCRSQVKRIENAGIRHPLQALLQIVIARSGSAQSVN